MSRYEFILDRLKRGLPTIRLYISSTSLLTAGLAAQSIGFIILARALGSEQFGHFSTITAATNLASAWCGVGSGEALRRRVGREPSLYPDLLGHCLIIMLSVGAVLTVVMAVAIAFFVRIVDDPVTNYATIALLVSSNIVLFQWVTLAEQVLLAHSEFARANRLNFWFAIARALTAMVACLGFGIESLSAWAWWNFATFVAGSLVCIWLLSSYGAPRWRLLREEIPFGITLSISSTIAALRQNIDLLALSVTAPPQLVGAYGAARRVLGVAVVTSSSLDRLIYNKFAIAGKGGTAATLAIARRYLPYTVLLTGITSAAIFVTAPLFPLLFTNTFGDMVWIVRALCWTLVLTAVQFLAFDAINAAEQHYARLVVGTAVGITGSAAILGFSLAFGTTGTFIAIYLTEIANAVALWVTLKVLSRRQKNHPAVAEHDGVPPRA